MSSESTTFPCPVKDECKHPRRENFGTSRQRDDHVKHTATRERTKSAERTGPHAHYLDSRFGRMMDESYRLWKGKAQTEPGPRFGRLPRTVEERLELYKARQMLMKHNAVALLELRVGREYTKETLEKAIKLDRVATVERWRNSEMKKHYKNEKFPEHIDDNSSDNNFWSDEEKADAMTLVNRERLLQHRLLELQNGEDPQLIADEKKWWQDVKTKVEKDEKDEGDESLIGSSSAEPSAAARLTDPGPQEQVPHSGFTTQTTHYSTKGGNQLFPFSSAILKNSGQQHNTHGEDLTDYVDWHKPTPQLPYHYMPHGFHYNPRTRRAEMHTDDGKIELTMNNSDDFWWATEDSVPALRKKSARWIAERGIFISRDSSYHRLGPVATINDLARYKAVRWRHHSRMLNVLRNLA